MKLISKCPFWNQNFLKTYLLCPNNTYLFSHMQNKEVPIQVKYERKKKEQIMLDSSPKYLQLLCIILYTVITNYTANFLMQSLFCDRAVTMWWLYFHLLVAQVAGYKTICLCHLDSYTVTVCYCIPSWYPCSDSAVAFQVPSSHISTSTPR